MKRVKLPSTDSIEILARFWDAHDLTEFEEQLEEVPEPIFERTPPITVTLHLQPQEVEAVKRAAQARGVEEAILLREWIVEKLRDRAKHIIL